MTIGIYKIENKINGKKYVGQSVHIEIRWSQHKSNPNRLLGKALKKYGVENFDFSIIKKCREEELCQWEDYYINFYDCVVPKGYNIETFSGGRKTSFTLYDSVQFEEIIQDIKEEKLLFREIAEKHDLSIRTIIRINMGETHYMAKENYPLRERDVNPIAYCIDCGIKLSQWDCKRCMKCDHINQRRCERPEPLKLAKLVAEYGFEGVGRMHGVSGNAVKKWCKHYNIPHLKKELVEWYQEKMSMRSK